MCPDFASTKASAGLKLVVASGTPVKVAGEAGLGANHLPINHWMGVQVFSSSAARAKQQLAILWPLSKHLCCYSLAANVIWSPVDGQLERDVVPQHERSKSLAEADSLAVYTYTPQLNSSTEVSGMVLTSDVPRYTHAALQLLSYLRHPSLHNPATPQLLAAVGETEPLAHSTDLVMDESLLHSMCLIEGTLVSNESFISNANGAVLTGDEMKSEVSGLSSLPPSSDAKPLLDGVRLLEDSTTNNMAERAFSFEDMSTDGKAGDSANQADEPHSESGALTPEEEYDDYKSQVDTCPPPFTVWFGELAGEVMEIYKEAGAMACHSLVTRLHSAYNHCAANYARAGFILKFWWKELCGDCQHAVRAVTGDFNAVVIGCKRVVLLLVASVMWMIRRLLRLEKQLTLSRRSNHMRHESSLVNHRSSKLYIKELESTSEGLKRGLNFAHRLLGNHHVRTGRRHKAAKGSLSLLKRQQIRARRQRLALKKQLRRAVAQQSLLERKMERLHNILDVVLQMGRSLRTGNTAQAAGRC
ncbi:hypothetical protein WJX82_007677 [Trebouxia sp. C0006]